ncbi:MAG: hypothetical protein EOO78_01585 [Oxalobacteraceae bacterium]|nr:MAG: hypothetical protein EOO78_01585 [Oxalobacteraceae bacterium]
MFAGLLTACQASQPDTAGQKRPMPVRGAGASAGSSSAGAMTMSGSGEKAGVGSWYGMCELNRKIMGAHTLQERQAIAEQALPDMSQEARAAQLKRMQQSCP